MSLPALDMCQHDPFLYKLWMSDRDHYYGKHGTNKMFIGHRRIDTSIQLMLKHLPPPSTAMKVADFACGLGNVGFKFAEMGCAVDFVDNESKFFDFIRLKKCPGDIRFIKADIGSYVGETKYHAIFLGEAIEHMARPDLTLKALRENLLTGGILCLTTPNGNYVDCDVPSWEEVKDQTERNEKLANSIGNHVCEFLPAELTSLIKEAGFNIREQQLVIAKQVCKSSLLRRLLPKSMLYALDDKFSKSENTAGKEFGKIQIIVADRAH